MRFSKRLLIVLVGIGQCFYSCKINEFKKSRLRKDNDLFTFSAYNNPVPGGGAAIIPTPKLYRSTGIVQVRLREDSDGLFITAVNPNEVIDQTVPGTRVRINYSSDASNLPAVFGSIAVAKRTTQPPSFFFNATDAKNLFSIPDASIRYKQLRPYLQVMTIAVKFRKKIDATVELPAAPAQIEAGSGVATIALATGIKHSWSKYTGSKNALGFSTISHSLAGGFLLGLGSADLKAGSTRGQVTGSNFETKNLTIPVGVHLVYGYNNINLGVAFGQDIITGPNRTDWNYFGKMWSAIIVGIDIIK